MVQDRCHLTPVDYAQINGQDLCFNYLNEVIGEWVGLVGEWERENGMLAFKSERKREGVGAKEREYIYREEEGEVPITNSFTFSEITH